jgi:UDP-N-acetylglucosamine 2-epimerase (non-hydrolysing)
MVKVLSIFGTRPEAIKMAMLVKKLNQCSTIEHHLCVTAQHREMLDQVLSFFEIIPDYDLNIMKHSQDLTDITCEVLKGLRDLFKINAPDIILVQGDTTTCMAASLAAFYAGIKIGHIEAGLRTGNLRAPFPEEANRLLVSRLSDFHFAPTIRNKQNLEAEGICPDKIIVTGNTVIDALLYAKDKVNNFTDDINDPAIRELFRENEKIILVTGHRRENFGKGFINICHALKRIALDHPGVNIVYPVHLNPNVKIPVMEILHGIKNIHLINPLSYPDFVYAMKQSYIIVTDSGGVQEEAPGLGKPVLVMRETTERPEALEAGTVRLVGTNQGKIIEGIENLLINREIYLRMSKAHNPYGDGFAVSRIVNFLNRNFN